MKTVKERLVLWAVLAFGCGSPTDECRDKGDITYPKAHPERVSIQQGIWGLVAYWEGDFMPVCVSGTVRAAGREMRVHAATSCREEIGPFYKEVSTPEVARVWSDADGFFQVSLPPGEYSLFSLEDSLLYANGCDSRHIRPVTVHPDSVVKVTFDITWDATS